MSYNFITFPFDIKVPAQLFTMRGPFTAFRRVNFELLLLKARNPRTGSSDVTRSFFHIKRVRENEAIVELIRSIPDRQDIELQLKMNIYSRELKQGAAEVFLGQAQANIKLFVTKREW